MERKTTHYTRLPESSKRNVILVCILLLAGLTQATWCSVVNETFAGLPVLTGGQNNANNTIWSYEFAKMLQDDLTKGGQPYYQDLQMVFTQCHSGGMVDAIKTLGLPGNYSAVSSRPLMYVSRFGGSLNKKGPWAPGDDWKSDGLPGHYLTDKLPIQYKNFFYVDRKAGYGISDTPTKDAKDTVWYTNSYGAQYILGLQSDPKRSAQQLATYAEDNFGIGPFGNSAYAGNGATSTINGDDNTKSKHAILWYSGAISPFLQNNIQALSKFLMDQHYGNVTTLFADPTSAFPLPGFDRTNWQQATKANLDAALKTLAGELQKHPGQEKAFLYFDGHGGLSEERRQFRTKDPDPPEPGQGYVYDSTHNHITLPLDPAFQSDLQQGIKKPGGGFLKDDPSLHRVDPPWLNLTTYSEHAGGAMQVFLDGISAGSIPLNGVRGEYSIALPDSVLAQLPWSPTADMNLDISFAFASPDDWFQISTSYDYYLDPVFSSSLNSYGIGIENTLVQGPYATPEPASLLLAGSGFLVAGGFLRKKVWRRT